MEKFNRAVRRHHIARLKANRKNYWGFGAIYNGSRLEATPGQLGVLTHTPRPCSCYSCSRSRTLQGPTIAERSFAQRQLHDE